MTHTITRCTRELLVGAVAFAASILMVASAAFAQASSTQAPINIGIFVGSSIDSFAAGDLRKYINPDDSNTLSEQLVAGFDFDYQLYAGKTRKVWLYGETVHGARSGEVDCSKDANASKDACKIASLDAPSAQGALAIFRKATTLEGMLGLRAEVAEMGPTGARSAFYVKGQMGFLSVAGRGGDLVDMHHAGLGLRLKEGVFSDSYFEVGYGRNDLFESNTGRTKIDAYLTFGRGSTPRAKPFFQMVIDSDFKSGPDNIQTFFGLNLDVLELFK
ncbi:MAG: hypothetical protein U0Q11_25330 [Vicinamibacterales bacterium]